MQALKNLQSIIQTNEQLLRLEAIQREVQQQMSHLSPVEPDYGPEDPRSNADQYYDPFKPQKTSQEQLNKNQSSNSIKLTKDQQRNSNFKSKQKQTKPPSLNRNNSNKKFITSIAQPSYEEQGSLLTSDIFEDAETLRRKYLQMFLPDTEPIQNSYQKTIDDDINERDLDDLNYTQTMKSKQQKKVQKMRHASQDSQSFERESEQKESLEEINFDLTKKSKTKHVSFKAQSPEKNDQISESKLNDLAKVISQISDKTDQANQILGSSVTCENPILLEVLMEHIVLNWDELGEQLLKEEINML